MESKGQSKLPDGLGKKIIQALKTQGSPGQAKSSSIEGNVQNTGYENPLTPKDEHGLETLSHMDFGDQEVQLDRGLSTSEFSEYMDSGGPEVPDLESISGYTEQPQYGSFAASPDEGYAGDEFGSYQQQSYENFDYNQQSYENFDTSYEPQPDQVEEIPEYQTPKLGYKQESYQPYQESPPETGYTYDETQDYSNQDFSDYSASNIPEDHIPQLDQYDDYSSDDSYGTSTSEDIFQEEQYSQPQIGFPQPDMMESQGYYQQPIQEWTDDYSTQESSRVLDLDAVQPQQPTTQYKQPEITSRPPLNLDQFDYNTPQQERDTRVKKPTPPVRPEHPLDKSQTYYEPQAIPENKPQPLPEDRYYQEPPKDYQRTEERYYQEPPKDYQRTEERYYQEPPKDYQRPEERHYQEPPRDYQRPEERYYPEPPKDYQRPEERYYPEPPKDYQRPEERYYQEPPKDYQRPEERYYQEPPKDYQRPEERHYQEPPKDYQRPEERQYQEPPYPQQHLKGEKATPYKSELFNSNVETLIKLVSTLPPGVTRQTGAHIIRQTMEAMGISMTDVLSDAQGAQARLQNYIKENFNTIEEHKILIKRMEEDIHSYQRKAKELDDIISLFILSDQYPRSR